MSAGHTRKASAPNTYDIIPREDWEVIEGCHEAIVTPEEWEQVQEIIDRRPTIMKGNACPFYNLFHGLVYCATCGKSMQVRYEKVGRTGKNRFTGEMREPIDKAYYICQTYNRLGKNACTSHKIEARDLYNLVLKDIQELAAQAMKDADCVLPAGSAAGWSAGIWWTLPRLRRNGNGWKPGIRKLTGCF